MKNKRILIPALSAVATATVAAPLILTLSSCGSKWDGDDVIEEYKPNFDALKLDEDKKLNLVDGNDLWFEAYKNNHSIPNEEYKWSTSGISWAINYLADMLEEEEMIGQRVINLTKYNAKLADFRINSEEVTNGQTVRRVSYRAVNDIVIDFNYDFKDANDLEVKNIHGSLRLAFNHTVTNMPFGLFDIGTDNLFGGKPFINQTLWFFGPDMSRVTSNDDTWSLDFDFLTEGGVYLNDDKLLDLGNEFKVRLDKWASFGIETIIELLTEGKKLPEGLGTALGWQVERLIPMLAGWNSYYLSKTDHYDHINSHQDDKEDEDNPYGWTTRATTSDNGFVVANTSWSDPATIRYELGEKGVYKYGDGNDIPEGEIPDIFCLPIRITLNKKEEKREASKQLNGSILPSFDLPKITIPQELTATSYVSKDGGTLSVVWDWNKDYWKDVEGRADGRPWDGFQFSNRFRPAPAEEKILPVVPDEPVANATSYNTSVNASVNANSDDGKSQQTNISVDGLILPLIFTRDWVAIGRPFDLCETKNVRFDETIDPETGKRIPVTEFPGDESQELAGKYVGNIRVQVDKNVYQILDKYNQEHPAAGYEKWNAPFEMSLTRLNTEDNCANMDILLTDIPTSANDEKYVEWDAYQATDETTHKPLDKYYLEVPFVSDDLGLVQNKMTNPYALVIKYTEGEGAMCVIGDTTPIRAYLAAGKRWNNAKSKWLIYNGESQFQVQGAFELSLGNDEKMGPVEILDNNGNPLDFIKADLKKERNDSNFWTLVINTVKPWPEGSTGFTNCAIKITTDTAGTPNVYKFNGFNIINLNSTATQGFEIECPSSIEIDPDNPKVGPVLHAQMPLPNGGEFNVSLFDGEHNVISVIQPQLSYNEGSETLTDIGVELNAMLDDVGFRKCTLVVSYEYTDAKGNTQVVYGSTKPGEINEIKIIPAIKTAATWVKEGGKSIWNDKNILLPNDAPQEVTSPNQLFIKHTDQLPVEMHQKFTHFEFEDGTPISDEYVTVAIQPDGNDGFFSVTVELTNEGFEWLQANPGALTNIRLYGAFRDRYGTDQQIVITGLNIDLLK